MAVSPVTIESVISAFDKLTSKFKAELMVEYKAQRITGDKYAEVYNALMAQSMQQAVGFVIQAQQGDANSELIAQKVITEKAQVQDKITELVTPNGNEGIVLGTVGKQKSVYDAQVKGFKDKSMQDAAKSMIDVWSVQRSTDSGISPNQENKLYDTNIGAAVNALYTQIGIAPAAPSVQAYVHLTNSDGTANITSGTAKITGFIGTIGEAIIAITVSDGTNSVSVDIPSVTNKEFTVSSVNVSTLANTDLTCTLKVRTSTGADISDTDNATKVS